MTASIVNYNFNASAASTLTFMASLPTSLVASNKLYMFLATSVNSATYSIGTPAGWAVEADLRNNNAASRPRLTVLSKTSDGSEGSSVVLSPVGGTPTLVWGQITVQVQDHNGKDVDGIARNTTDSTTHDSPSVITTVNDCLVLRVNTSLTNLTTDVSAPPTLVHGFANGTTVLYIGVSQETKASAGATGAATWTFNDPDSAVSYTIAIKSNALGLTISTFSVDNQVYSSEIDAEIVGTGLSAGQTITYKGVACTSKSASGSTSIKVTLPDFWTNNIKLGVQHELKVTD